MSIYQLQVALNLSKLSDAAKLNKSSLVIGNINNNAASFPSAVALTPGVAAALEAAKTALTNAQDGSKKQKAQAEDAVRALVAEMNALGAAVGHDAKGDVTIVHLAGLDIKNPKPAGGITGFEVRLAGESGKVLLRVKPKKGAAYLWEYSSDASGAGAWVEAASGTSSKATIEGLTPGIKYLFRYAYIDRDGRHPFSSPVSAFVA